MHTLERDHFKDIQFQIAVLRTLKVAEGNRQKETLSTKESLLKIL